jgi:hypothetical protein
MAWYHSKRSLLKLLQSDYKWGRASNYPICCIVHYLLRNVFIQKAPVETVERYFDKQQARWVKEGGDDKDFAHISCLGHHYLNRLGLYKPKYSYCKEHEWEQLGDKPCSICATGVHLRDDDDEEGEY